MKVETTIALPMELLRVVDACSADFGGRSRFIEAALRAFVGGPSEAEVEARDLEIINRHADELNEEAADALELQVPL
ncbi:MAG: hypothetical protein GY842_04620 [bacterium]|nr:hypothetical protein [bacterium]